MADKDIEKKLRGLEHDLQCASRFVLRLEDRIAALESERGIALAAYAKTHPEVMSDLNKIIEAKPTEKKPRG